MRSLVKDVKEPHTRTSNWNVLLINSERFDKLRQNFPDINANYINYEGEDLLTNSITFYYNYNNCKEYYSWVSHVISKKSHHYNCKNYNNGYWRKETCNNIIIKMLIKKHLNYVTFNKKLQDYIKNPNKSSVFGLKLFNFLETTGLTVQQLL